MFSIRNSAVLAVGILSFVNVGCQFMTKPRAEKVNDSAVIVDDAMLRRDWDRKTAYYPNGATIGGGIGYVFKTHQAIPQVYHRAADPAVAAGNIVILPATIWFNPPWVAVEHRGAIIPPTYTGNPPLPQ